ncbi:hypothetical protein FRC17_001003 [Serendipita sp. 399]|nr:hypothetical protein FRC17_001003 [Serendipita sp. 399]
MARNSSYRSWKWTIANILTILQAVKAAHDVTIQDSDSSIVYRGAWKTETRADCSSGSCHYTTGNGESFIYSFTGATRVRYIGHLETDSSILLRLITGSDISQPGTTSAPAYDNPPPQSVMWDSGVQFNPSQRYILQVQKTGPSGTGRGLYVDAFILTVPDEGEMTISPSTSSALGSKVVYLLDGIVQRINVLRQVPRGDPPSPPPLPPPIYLYKVLRVGCSQSGSVTATGSVSGPSIEGNGGSGGSSSNSNSAGIGDGPNTGNAGSSEMKSSTKAAIIGGTLGGLALVCILATIVFFYRRRRRQRAEIESVIYETAEAGSSEARGPTTITTYNVTAGSHPSTAALRLKEMQERERIGAPSEASGSGTGTGSAQQVQPSLHPSQNPLPGGSTPVDEYHSSPGFNRMSIHHEDWLSPVSQAQSWMLTNPPAYTVRPIEGHVHADGDTMSDY